ncbi:glycosyltransferase [Clostridium tyrobutyricum]|uniref:glycosyltransferase n=1 Tax=Clostridium tyrobutyricum TaxID=1519 RepID=UPI0018C60102|nr:glycosyltransferase [Clostridium tyrobutyricum]
MKDTFSKVDCIIISRAMSPKICLFPLAQFMRMALKRSNVIWDFDDEIFVSKEITNTEKRILIELSDSIVVISNYLKNLLPERVHNKVILLPTTDGDLQKFNLDILNNERKKKFDKTVELLWLATAYSMPHLEKIGNILEESAKKVKLELNKDLILNVVCNKPFLLKTKYLKINNIFWTRDVAIKSICNAHIGIMPLVNTKLSLGKGGFKIIQYMAAGLPAIASNIGFNNEVIIDGKTGRLVNDEIDMHSWSNAIMEVASDWRVFYTFSLNSLKAWEKNFSFKANLNEWKNIIH